jgi:septum formation protein
MRTIILASQSPQRKMMMDTLDIVFKVIPAALDEKQIQDQDLKQRAQKIALLKALTVSSNNREAIVIAADTYGEFQGQAFEKPVDKNEAKQMLNELSGQWFKAYTGFAYLDPIQSIKVSDVVETRAQFRDLSEEEIDYYVDHNPVTTWSVGFSPAYSAGAALISLVDGSLTSFTHGLPIELVVSNLKKSHVLI